jgi:protein Mpv17
VPFQFLNFRFVPVNLQVGAANVIALMWNTYMSWVTHLEVKPVEPEPKGKKGKK